MTTRANTTDGVRISGFEGGAQTDKLLTVCQTRRHFEGMVLQTQLAVASTVQGRKCADSDTPFHPGSCFCSEGSMSRRLLGRSDGWSYEPNIRNHSGPFRYEHFLVYIVLHNAMWYSYRFVNTMSATGGKTKPSGVAGRHLCKRRIRSSASGLKEKNSPDTLVHQGLHIRKRLSVAELWQSLLPNQFVDFLLGLLLSVRVVQ